MSPRTSEITKEAYLVFMVELMSEVDLTFSRIY
jgi:hypothetical protein